MSDMSLYHWASSEAWRVSIQLIALFISSWRCRTLSGYVLKMSLGEACECGALGTLVSSGPQVGRMDKVSGLCEPCPQPYLIVMTPVGKEAFPSEKLDLSSLPPRGFPPHWQLRQFGP